MNDDALEQGYLYVQAELQRGVSLDEVRNQLIAGGWTPQDAATVIQRAHQGNPIQTGSPAYIANDASPNGGRYESNSPYSSSEPYDSRNAISQSSMPDYNSHPMQEQQGKNWSAKAVLLLMGGGLCFLIAFGVVGAVITGMIQGKAIRIVVGLILAGGAMLKNGFDALNK